MTQTLTVSSDPMAILNQPGVPVVAVLAVKFAVFVTKSTLRYRTRRALKTLEPWQLRDVGLTQEQADTEASRAFWKA